ncbi:MAG: radical SAM protein [Candidatus Magasanikbacteria bacterium]
MSKQIMPIDCVLGITYNCNSRCVMCDIWKIKDSPELSLEQYKKLPKTLRDINISGGEPFLRKDLVELVKTVVETCPKARIVISSNGFLPAMIEKQMKEILKIKPDIGIAISVDGYGDMHEKIRRIPGAWNKVMDTIQRLQGLGMKNIRIAFTILEQNIQDFSKVYEVSKKMGVQFTHAFAQSSEFYFGGIQYVNHPDVKELQKQYYSIISQELQSWNLKRWLRAYFAYGLYNFATKKEQVLSNDPGTRFFYLDPDGIVYPSVVHNFPMADIEEYKTWKELWSSDFANKARNLVKTKGQPAWMVCTARTALKKHPMKVGLWILRNKFFGVKL